MNADPSERGGGLARAALALALACALAALIAGPGFRFGWWPLGVGIQTIRWAATVALAAVGLGLVALLRARGWRRTRWLALAGLALGLVIAVPPTLMWRRLQTLPHLHDISTDMQNPPVFVAIAPLRQGARNALDYDPKTAGAQQQGFPDIAPLIVAMPPERALAKAERTARALGWEVVAVTPQAMRVEATETSLLFGFKDDVVIRIGAAPEGSRVDVRSASRVGGFDFGVNAARVRKFIALFSD